MSRHSKIDNSHTETEAEIRRRCLGALGAKPCVLDCFAGDGEMWKTVYSGHEYLDLDQRDLNDGRRLARIDNRVFLKSSDLSRWNVFDLDAYGSPWEQFWIICNLRKMEAGERIAIALTDGLGFKMNIEGEIPKGMKRIIGIPYEMTLPCMDDASLDGLINYKCNLSILSEDYSLYTDKFEIPVQQFDLYCFEASLYKHWTKEFKSRRVFLSFGFLLKYSDLGRDISDPRVRLSKRILKNFQK